MCRISLYRHESEDIRIYIDAYFESGELVVEGQDIGETVEKWWGDSDYEYGLKVQPSEADKLYPLFDVEKGDEESLLSKIADKYNTNTCFSDFMSFLSRNNIKFEAFTWA